jgi:stringent starvation protein B
MVPVANVMAIYARETGQGMAFPPEEDEVPEDGDAPLMDDASPTWSRMKSPRPSVVQLVPVKAEAEASGEDDALVRLRPQVAVRRSSV